MSYIFFDIDGTLRTRDDYTIPCSCLEAIKALKQKGHTVFIATGRGFYSALGMSKRLGIDHFISDGGRVVYYNHQIVYTRPMDKEIVDKVTRIAKEKNIAIGYSNLQAIHSTSSFFSDSFSLDDTIICSIKENLEENYLEPIYKMYLKMDRDSYNQDDFLNSLEHHQLRKELVVIEHEHKDEGILYLKQFLNFSLDECICFGDDVNDISMFELCKTSVCMANGSDKAKQYATYIAPNIHQDGIFKACKALKLI